ncbi:MULTISPECIES: hypothetical protein [Pseudanabaena]|uniref:CRISPR-associated protein Csc2 n=2 Tax=Pseudanabaena TaxID=1152 RepID=L8N4F2_9CYAN|nr:MULTISPECIES: hypothetical protein [Pseudanabaena]ELS33113.1 hypothetical protein Pse7429DRAFT_1853 [Pseudanabaena biceps PCC 7429]MDG3494673.1 hypothetical protein [Pseudanabaena catenata USMAC16]
MSTGLPATDAQNPRMHFDIYAILEGSQELYLGHEVQVNINLVEVVKLQTTDGKSIEKCYISPTKRRGVERRSLIWSPVKSGTLLGDKLKCGIPETCAQPECPICSTFGGLIAGKKTLIGRVTHSGGVAVQELYPVDKQRAMHPARLVNQKEETPIPFKRQYNQPGLLYPVYNHALSITEKEFAAVAYAFLDSLARIGSGNPKGVSLAEDSTKKPLLVFDRYLVPRGKRPIISPSVTNAADAIADFQRLAHTPTVNTDHISEPLFDRWIGDAALEKLQEYAGDFVNRVLQAS